MRRSRIQTPCDDGMVEYNSQIAWKTYSEEERMIEHITLEIRRIMGIMEVK